MLLPIDGGALGFAATVMALCLASGPSYAVYTLLNRRMSGHAQASVITLAAFGLALVVAGALGVVRAEPAGSRPAAPRAVPNG